MATNKEETGDLTVLPIDDVAMPAEDVSDLRDVVDAINRLCDTMKTPSYDDVEREEQDELVAPEQVIVRRVETYVAEKWSDSIVEEASDSEQVAPISEYYTASSEVSLISTEMCQASNGEMNKVDRNYASSEASLLSDELANFGEDSDKERYDRNGVMAGHVAAMRERFESMTRASTPCPDALRSTSPSFDIFFRNITPSPDLLDKS